MNNQNAKADKGKPKLSLVPTEIINCIARCREYGTMKYHDPDNWKDVEKDRYIDAAYRHWIKYVADNNSVDEESGLPHLWHCACNLAFLCEFDKVERETKELHEKAMKFAKDNQIPEFHGLNVKDYKFNFERFYSPEEMLWVHTATGENGKDKIQCRFKVNHNNEYCYHECEMIKNNIRTELHCGFCPLCSKDCKCEVQKKIDEREAQKIQQAIQRVEAKEHQDGKHISAPPEVIKNAIKHTLRETAKINDDISKLNDKSNKDTIFYNLGDPVPFVGTYSDEASGTINGHDFNCEFFYEGGTGKCSNVCSVNGKKPKEMQCDECPLWNGGQCEVKKELELCRKYDEK